MRCSRVKKLNSWVLSSTLNPISGVQEQDMEHKFYSVGCPQCGGLQFGNDQDGNDFIPIFHNQFMADMTLTSWEENYPVEEGHSPKVIEIAVRIL